MGFLSPDLAIDIGSSHTRIFVKGEGVVLSEPSLLAVRRKRNGAEEVVAIGDEAKAMQGRLPKDISILEPLAGGAVSDSESLGRMLRLFFEKKRLVSGLRRPQTVVAVPLDLTSVERFAVVESVAYAGSRQVQLLPSLIAAAIGLSFPISEPTGHFVIDLGAGTIELGAVSLSGVVTSSSSRRGGAQLNGALREYLRAKRNLLIGDQTAERLKCELASAIPTDDMESLEVRGRDLIGGVPSGARIDRDDVREALDRSIAQIVTRVSKTLERVPAEIAGDLYETGLVMVGGASQLPGLDRRLREVTGLPVVLAENPTDVVVNGAGRVVESPGEFPGLFV